MRGLVAARAAVLPAIAAIDADMKKLVRASHACRRLMTIPGVGHLTALAFAAAVDDPERFRRSRDLGAYLAGSGAASLSIRRGRLHRQHLQMRRPADANSALRCGECHPDALPAAAAAEGLGVGARQT